MMTFFNKQRGAMFGLDARVGLAILAGLSIITGSALVFTSSQAEGASLHKEVEVIKEAVIAVQYDTKTPIQDIPATPDVSNTFHVLLRKDYVSPALQPRWLGPYIISHWITTNAKFGLRTIVVGTETSPTTVCASDCYLWLSIADVPVSIAESFNEIVDGLGELSPDTSGEVRWADNAGENLVYVRLMEELP